MLKVPLDFLSDSKDTRTASIALQMLPAADAQNVLGTIVLGSGGPGLPGTPNVKRWGKNVADIVGPNYNILGFDPRGTGASTPSAQCFESDVHHQILGLRARQKLISLADDSVAEARAWEQLIAQKCMDTLGGHSTDASGETPAPDGGRFMSSASVATDMLRITDKLGQDRLHYWGFVSIYGPSAGDSRSL